MRINTNQIVSMSEANQNFSKVARMVENQGVVYIFKNNKPIYEIKRFEDSGTIQMSDDERIDFVAARILKLYRKAFEELAR